MQDCCGNTGWRPPDAHTPCWPTAPDYRTCTLTDSHRQRRCLCARTTKHRDAMRCVPTEQREQSEPLVPKEGCETSALQVGSFGRFSVSYRSPRQQCMQSRTCLHRLVAAFDESVCSAISMAARELPDRLRQTIPSRCTYSTRMQDRTCYFIVSPIR